MSFWDTAKDAAAAASVGIALSGTVAAATPADLQAATVDNFAHSSQERSEQSASQAMSEATISAGDTGTSQAK